MGRLTFVSLEKPLRGEHRLVFGALAAPREPQLARWLRRLRGDRMGLAPEAQLSPVTTRCCLLTGCRRAKLCFRVPTISGAQKDSHLLGRWHWDAQGVARLLGRGKALLSSFSLGYNLITEVAAFSHLSQLTTPKANSLASFFLFLFPLLRKIGDPLPSARWWPPPLANLTDAAAAPGVTAQRGCGRVDWQPQEGRLSQRFPARVRGRRGEQTVWGGGAEELGAHGKGREEGIPSKPT